MSKSLNNKNRKKAQSSKEAKKQKTLKKLFHQALKAGEITLEVNENYSDGKSKDRNKNAAVSVTKKRANSTNKLNKEKPNFSLIIGLQDMPRKLKKKAKRDFLNKNSK